MDLPTALLVLSIEVVDVVDENAPSSDHRRFGQKRGRSLPPDGCGIGVNAMAELVEGDRNDPGGVYSIRTAWLRRISGGTTSRRKTLRCS
jgi:hypothetical protein